MPNSKKFDSVNYVDSHIIIITISVNNLNEAVHDLSLDSVESLCA